MNLLALAILAGLGAYRVARIIVSEDGPFDAFARLRAELKVDKQDTWIRRGLACVACVSFWTAAVFAVPATIASGAGFGVFVPVWMAAACVAVVLMRRVG